MTLVQLREKLADGGHFLAEARAVIEVAHQHGVGTALWLLICAERLMSGVWGSISRH